MSSIVCTVSGCHLQNSSSSVWKRNHFHYCWDPCCYSPEIQIGPPGSCTFLLCSDLVLCENGNHVPSQLMPSLAKRIVNIHFGLGHVLTIVLAKGFCGRLSLGWISPVWSISSMSTSWIFYKTKQNNSKFSNTCKWSRGILHWIVVENESLKSVERAIKKNSIKKNLSPFCHFTSVVIMLLLSTSGLTSGVIVVPLGFYHSYMKERGRIPRKYHCCSNCYVESHTYIIF